MSNDNDPQARPIPSGPSFAGDLNGDFVQGDQHKGDKIEGDKVTGGQVKADTIEGGVTQTNTVKQGNNYQEQVKQLFDEMSKEAPELTEEQVNELVPAIEAIVEGDPEPKVLEPADFEAFEPEVFDGNEDHPAVVYASVQRYEESGVTPTEEEQKSLFSRMVSSVKKYATSPEAVGALKLVASGIEATASIAPPLNIINAVIKTGVALASGKE